MQRRMSYVAMREVVYECHAIGCAFQLTYTSVTLHASTNEKRKFQLEVFVSADF